MKFKEHIEEKSKKAQTVLNMIRRNFYFAPKSVKNKAYISTVRPIMEFASICWDPSQENLKTKLEKVQNTAARFVTNQYSKKENNYSKSITETIKKLGWETLEKRRKNAKLTMAYKILNGNVILEPEWLPKKGSVREIRNEENHHLRIPLSKLDSAKKTFFFDVPRIWNSQVSAKLAEAPSTEAFKNNLI